MDLHIDLGTAIVSGVGLVMSWTAHKGVRILKQFVQRVDNHGDRLDETQQMVDYHTKIFIDKGDIKPPGRRLFRRRRTDATSDIDIILDLDDKDVDHGIT